MSNQELTPQQKHVQSTIKWNQKNKEYVQKQSRLRSRRSHLKNAIPKMELKIIHYKLRIQLIDKQLDDNSKSKQQIKQEPKKEHVQPIKKPSDSTICYICDIPFTIKEGLLRHNARRHG